MEEETSSSISNAKANINAEAFDSSSCSSWSHQAVMPSETEGHVSNPKFKGVVSHANGHWGAQIYAKHQRVWLGTFRTEKEAAMAYDSAAIRLRNGDSHRNFPWTSANDQEQNFQSQYTTEAILNMIKDGSYLSKFTDFLTSQRMKKEFDPDMLRVHGSGSGNDNEGLCYKLLFQKELTPSDVGKLNRLVIPKKHAIKYFPRISGNPKENTAEGNNDDGQLVFYDREMKSWKFRYCYWKSSQSFVFTKGWNRFVRENNLKENDIVAFYTCEVPKEGQPFCIIDVVHKGNSSNAALQAADMFPGTGDYMEEEEEENNECEDLGSTNVMEKKGFRLFGVQIT